MNIQYARWRVGERAGRTVATDAETVRAVALHIDRTPRGVTQSALTQCLGPHTTNQTMLLADQGLRQWRTWTFLGKSGSRDVKTRFLYR